MIDQNILNLVKYFISSNSSLTELKNPYLISLLKQAGIKIPCDKTFKITILPEVVKLVMDAINKKLDQSLIISLIVDMWSDPQMTSFMGLACMITTNESARECFVLGLEEMHDSPTAENV